MGKAQSKRSVDITIEAKKDDVIEEGTGKMGKIEDVDQLKPQVNGDTHRNDTDVADKEKAVEAEGTENEKDLSTEKEQQPQTEPKTNLEAGDEAVTTPTDAKPLENGNGTDDTLNESKNPAETSTTIAENGDDSSKKPKKEKVKKKWSLRSISFGKKDKQKPAKKEEGTTNGECEKVPEEVAEEATKTGEGNTDESTPAVDEKSNASPAAEKADETKDSVVVNGTTSEPAKDEKPASEPTPEPVAVPAAAIVVEEKKIEKEVTEETQKIETVVAEPKPTESLKSNVTEEPAAVTAKIEVKAESIQDDNAHKSSEADKTEIQQEIKSEELIKNINDDGDSESAQNLPPPPLPCTSPPSQVSVFALGDNKDHEQQLPPPIEVAQELPVAAEQAAESVGSPPAAAITLSSEIEEEVKSDEMKRTSEVELNLESSIASSTAPTQISVELASPVVDAAPQVIQTEDITAALPPVDVAAIKEVDNISHEASKRETEINSDQIAETIALIDEVTQEAVTISQHKLDETSAAINSSETESLKTEEEKIENIVTETSSNDPHPEDNSTPESTSISETNIPSVLLKDTEKPITQVESKPEEIVQVQEIDTTDIETKSKPNEIIGDHGKLAEQEAAIGTSEIQKDEIIITSVIDSEQPKETVDIVVPQTEEEPADKTETKLVDDTTPTTETEESSQVSKSKENGIGENHAAETSATESLNGQVDHKTIEEIKSDCSDKLNNEPTTELAAGTVQVKE